MKKKIVKITKWFCILFLLFLFAIFSINSYVKMSTKSRILSEEEIVKIENIDAILVLGAGIRNKKPSPMLEDRLLTGITLYENQVAPKMIMSGDHSATNYDEVNVMKNFAIQRYVPSSDIFMDHAGLSSYDSIYRAKEIFNVKKVVIVTQEYHLYRALYIAKQLGLEAYGITANKTIYAGQIKREFREILARNKDYFKCVVKPKPTFLGDSIPISGNGNVTNDY